MKWLGAALIIFSAFPTLSTAQIDMSKLTPEQQNRVKKILNERHCTCGCDMHIATCLTDDPSCETAPKLAHEIIDEVIATTPDIELKRVDTSRLTQAQKVKAYEILSKQNCTCGCGMAVTQCLADDPDCDVSPKIAQNVIRGIINKTPKIDLKRVDISHLSPAHQQAVFSVLSSSNCTCGCGMTIAKCLVDDPTCEVSPELAKAVIAKVAQTVTPPAASHGQSKALRSDGGKWYKEVAGKQLLYIYTGNGYRRKEKIWLCSDGSFQSSGYGGSISSLGSAAFSDGGRSGRWAVNGDVLTLAFSNGNTAKYKLSFYKGFLYLDNTRYFRLENDLCK